MKYLVVLFSAFTLLQTAAAQSNSTKQPPLDKSPMDMAYFPANYPILKIQDKATEPLLARVIYSRPQKNSRTIFGDLIEYGKVWRLGANEATEVEFFKDVYIGGKKVAKGRYTLYALVNPDHWTMILNKETDTWGSFKYDEKKDVARVNVPVQKLQESINDFTVFFDKTGSGASLVTEWDNVKVALPITLK